MVVARFTLHHTEKHQCDMYINDRGKSFPDGGIFSSQAQINARFSSDSMTVAWVAGDRGKRRSAIVHVFCDPHSEIYNA